MDHPNLDLVQWVIPFHPFILLVSLIETIASKCFHNVQCVSSLFKLKNNFASYHELANWIEMVVLDPNKKRGHVFEAVD